MSRKLALFFAFGFSLFLITQTAIAYADEITLMAVGDVLPHPSWHDADPPVSKLLENVSPTFGEADLVVGNLETPLTNRSEPTESKNPAALKAGKDFVFKSGDPEAAQGLKDAGFTVLTLANNHMCDYQDAGVLDTVARLTKAGVVCAGAGADADEACRPATLTVKGMDIVFLAASDIVPKDYEARADKPGIASMKDEQVFIERVKKAREENPDALLVLCLHWGVEATFAPTERQKELAHEFIDAGADLILGSHPHRVQGVEMYSGKPIFYSLGNFQFASKEPGNESVIASISYKDGSHEPDKVCISPVIIEQGGKPRVLAPTDPAYQVILGKMDKMCQGLGLCIKGEEVTAIKKAEVKAGEAVKSSGI
jgi:poly-gamma-glutamate capsule biosynthesis protein CapA/YwtB (metallophosphatase superfamily)